MSDLPSKKYVTSFCFTHFSQAFGVQYEYSIILGPHFGLRQFRPYLGTIYANFLVPVVQPKHKSQHPFIHGIRIGKEQNPGTARQRTML